ncbi:MAG: DUF5717 family protein [Defluviitaleaceae bacterium]|nr:DUF5717 family protein [Defluviitaleaceae bacterium]
MKPIPELLEQYENPLPQIKCDKTAFRLDTARDVYGEFTLTNASAGGLLSGVIESDLPNLSFTPASFSGNKIKVTFKFELGIYQPGDTANARIIVTSNGGEIVLPIYITVIAKTIATDDGTVLATLNDFHTLHSSNAADAAKLFARKDFGDWLSSMPNSASVNIELYNHLKVDANKERAADNFLICHGMKEKARIYTKSSETDITIQPGMQDGINGIIDVLKTAPGFAEADVFIPNCQPWLQLITTKLTDSSFNPGGLGCIDYVIQPTLFTKKRAMATVKINTHDEVYEHKLFVNALPILNSSLSKDTFFLQDSGCIKIINNTTGDLKVEIINKHDFIHFEGRFYLVSKTGEIPFTIKLDAGRFARIANNTERGGVARNNEFNRVEITLKTVFNGVLYTQTVFPWISLHKGIL